MNILAIPGKMPATESWLKLVLSGSNLCNENIKFQPFNAWTNGQEFNVDTEVNALAIGHYDLIITKSIGTLIMLKSSKISCDKLIFIGVALSLYSAVDRQLLLALKQKSYPILIIQEDHDPFGSYQQIHDLFGDSSHIQCVEVSGDHHQYKNVAELSNIINAWLK